MNHAASKLAEKKINYVNSTMLYGESGTGKTTFGRYVAYRLGLPFAYLNFSHVLDSYLGGSQKNISRVFDYVKRQKCVFMLDEVDAVGMRRGTGNEVGEMSKIVICLMLCLDTLSNDTVLLGATNRLDIIDEALLRRGTTRHEVEKFDIEDRKKIVVKFFDDE